MPQFEVHIPRATPDGIDVTARLRADSWTEALRQGLARLGDNADVRQVMCDMARFGHSERGVSAGRPGLREAGIGTGCLVCCRAAFGRGPCGVGGRGGH